MHNAYLLPHAVAHHGSVNGRKHEPIAVLLECESPGELAKVDAVPDLLEVRVAHLEIGAIITTTELNSYKARLTLIIYSNNILMSWVSFWLYFVEIHSALSGYVETASEPL